MRGRRDNAFIYREREIAPKPPKEKVSWWMQRDGEDVPAWRRRVHLHSLTFGETSDQTNYERTEL